MSVPRFCQVAEIVGNGTSSSLARTLNTLRIVSGGKKQHRRPNHHVWESAYLESNRVENVKDNRYNEGNFSGGFPKQCWNDQ